MDRAVSVLFPIGHVTSSLHRGAAIPILRWLAEALPAFDMPYDLLCGWNSWWWSEKQRLEQLLFRVRHPLWMVAGLTTSAKAAVARRSLVSEGESPRAAQNVRW